MLVRKSIIATCMLAAACAALAQGKEAGNSVIYVSPSVSGKADGAAPESGLPTLQGALDLAQKKFGAGARDVVIRVLPGRYVGQQARTAGAGKDAHLTITRAGDDARPEFDGADKTDTWLTVSGRVRQPANLTVSGLKIEHYGTAITMNGSRDALDNAVSHVEIRNNFFDTIGQASAGQGEPSTAVIRLVNGDDNQIVNNRFIHFRNAEKCGLLHAIYVAHDSTGNLIKGNQFEDGCGDAIRFRDRSSNNRVEGNRFADAWASAPITDWYCDASSRSDCTKRSGECPSLDNLLIGNQMVARHAPDKGLTTGFGEMATTMCPAPAGAQRFIAQ